MAGADHASAPARVDSAAWAVQPAALVLAARVAAHVGRALALLDDAHRALRLLGRTARSGSRHRHRPGPPPPFALRPAGAHRAGAGGTAGRRGPGGVEDGTGEMGSRQTAGHGAKDLWLCMRRAHEITVGPWSIACS
jgi:hypothetical protein